MSAWDIAGAVVWPITAVSLFAFGFLPAPNNVSSITVGIVAAFLVIGIVASLASAIFCIARLFGAHA